MRLKTVLSFSLLLLSLGITQLHAEIPTEVDGNKLPSLAPMLKKVTPSVVNISATQQIDGYVNPLMSDPFFRQFFNGKTTPTQQKQQNQGSGVIVDAKNGYILTNHHVIENSSAIYVMLRDKRKFEAKVIGSDPETDVAVLQIPAENLSAFELADSDASQVGDFVVAIGNPFGLGQTVTSGIISALGRNGLGIQGYEDFIQTDASINLGNSGGALVNLRGELIGINTAIIAPGGGSVGIGFAVPINMAYQLMQQLVKYGDIKRGRIGVEDSLQDLTPNLSTAFETTLNHGAVITEVEKNSSAEQAKLRPADIITGLNNKEVANSAHLKTLLSLYRPGEKVEINYQRDNKPNTAQLEIVAFKPSSTSGDQINPYLNGATFEEIDPSLIGGQRAVWIKFIERGSPAARTGLRAGDIILSINLIHIESVSVLLQTAKQSKQLSILIQRGTQQLRLNLRS